MTVADSRYKLLKEETCLQRKVEGRNDKNSSFTPKKNGIQECCIKHLVLTKASCTAYSFKKLSSRRIFHYNRQMCGG